MKKTTSYHLTSLLLLAFVGSSFAQRHETFAERPAKRLAFVEKMKERAFRDKQEARAWAKARGLPTREERGGRLRELMAIRDGKPLYYATLNKMAAISTATDLVRNTSPYNLNGAGLRVGVWDGGSVLSSHDELTGRVAVKDAVPTHYHSTHVAGTIGASGVDLNAKGMAPLVGIDSYDWFDDVGEVGSAGASAPNQLSKIYLSNHSYGYDIIDSSYYHFYGKYTSDVRQMDQALYGLQYCLPFAGAGNDQSFATYKDGYDTITFHGIAKNVMTVGAVRDAVNGSGTARSLADATMTTFSSWGPADDGRIKPDIVANGYYLYSCDDTGNSGYRSIPGTSMACPNACGSAALLVDYYDDLFPGGAMRASTLKGLIIHTADDLGNPGPDYQNGWGLMNTLAAAELLRDYAVGATLRLTEATVTTSQRSDSYTFQWDGIGPIRATLCWTDPPGKSTSVHDSRTPVLETDLDLKITGPGGSYYPYSLSYENPTNNATASGENNIDNVEQVYIATPVAGQYTITVDFDGALSGGEQWYSLLISGARSDSDGDGMPNSWESLYFEGSTNAVASADQDGDGSDNYSEYISGHNPTDPNSVFAVTSFTAPESGNTPFIITWDPVAGRIYNVSWSHGLIITPFTDISGDLPHPANSYTDAVERIDFQNFYRVDVRLAE